jgi:GNAT superfamily N-acetyltransferase
MEIVIREPVEGDVEGMARVHVDSWRETYRGLMPDEVLDDPDLLDRRRALWRSYFELENQQKYRVAVADQDGRIVGIAMVGASRDEDRPDDLHLFVLYTYAAIHGSGAGAGLLDAVLAPDESASLWVADPNPRAQAFYLNRGFTADGMRKTDEDLGVTEIRMVR